MRVIFISLNNCPLVGRKMFIMIVHIIHVMNGMNNLLISTASALFGLLKFLFYKILLVQNMYSMNNILNRFME